MMKSCHTRLCASAAIAAALALSSTPLLAQMAPAQTTVASEPVLVVPQTPAPPPAQPIMLPTQVPETAPPPTTVTTPERTTATMRTESGPAVPTPRPRVAAPAEPTPVAAQDSVEPQVEPVAADSATETVAEPVAPVAASEPFVESEQSGNDGAFVFGLAVIAAIAAIVLAIWGFIAIGRRRPVDRKAAAIIERPAMTPRAPQPEPVVQPVAAEPVPVAPVPFAASVSTLRTATPAPSLSHTGASVPLPRTVPATFEERDALIKRMVAAKPDRANPFTAPLQRRKRAKLILQSLGRDFGDVEPWIDLSQYPQNWPELAQRKHAAA